MINPLFWFNLYKWGFFICLPLSLGLFIFILLGYNILKRYLGAKLGKHKDLLLVLNNNGTAELTNTRRYKGILVKEGEEFVQDYERDGDKIKPLSYQFVGGTRLLKREGDIPVLNNVGKPASLDQAWLENFRNLDRIRILKKNKLLKFKVKPFPILIIIALILFSIIGYWVFITFVA